MIAVGGLKTCSKCGETKSINDFYKNASNKDRLGDYCKECHNKCIREGKALKDGKKNMILNISDFTDESLFAEIRKRGYFGELTYTKSVSI
jgi:hypothetical protein